MLFFVSLSFCVSSFYSTSNIKTRRQFSVPLNFLCDLCDSVVYLYALYSKLLFTPKRLFLLNLALLGDLMFQLAVSLLLLSQTAGIKTYEGQTLDSISHQGPLKVINCTVQNETNVAGTFDAINSTFRTLELQGRANIKNCSFTGQVLVEGFLEAEGSTFQKSMDLQTHRLVLRNSTTQDIQIEDGGDPNQFGTAELYNTIVNGNLTFNSGNGIVNLNGTSKITGTLSGGTIR